MLLTTIVSGLDFLNFQIEVDSPLLDPSKKGGVVKFDTNAAAAAANDRLGLGAQKEVDVTPAATLSSNLTGTSLAAPESDYPVSLLAPALNEDLVVSHSTKKSKSKDKSKSKSKTKDRDGKKKKKKKQPAADGDAPLKVPSAAADIDSATAGNTTGATDTPTHEKDADASTSLDTNDSKGTSGTAPRPPAEPIVAPTITPTTTPTETNTDTNNDTTSAASTTASGSSAHDASKVTLGSLV